MPGKRNPDDKISKLIGAVGECLTENGYQGLGVNKIAARAGVSKPMIYEYFGSYSGLLKAYVERKDSWMPYFATLVLPQNPSVDELKASFIRILQDQFCHFYRDREMQRLVQWQVSESSPLMRTASAARETEGLRLLNLVEGHFRNSGISLKAVMALLVGGIYFNVLNSYAGAGTVAGIDLKDRKDFDAILKSLAQIVDWAFLAAEKPVLA